MPSVACSTALQFRIVTVCLLLAACHLIGVRDCHAIQSQEKFPEVKNSPSEDNVRPMPAHEAAAKFKVPPGFKTTLFASEPEVQNPIAMAWDDRSRLWIAENFTYSDSKQRFDLSMRDRVLVFEDRDHDGKADDRKVFCDNVQMLTSVEVGLGGVWLMCPPQLLFVPDADGDAVPDGPARVVLDGFDVAQDNYHNFANGLRFGPDGWLYGRCGHSCPGRIGIPGASHEQRVPLDGGIWRYHPKQKIVEVLCHGTTNPWGHDWDQNGELFFINTVIGHLWHMVPGCHFKESFGESQNPRVYERMDMIADHYHFDRKGSWTDSRDGKANDLGGGHAHIGAMIYLGKQWPQEYHGRLFTLNMHGRRTNVERLERTGTGYVGKHQPDVFLAEDTFFRGIDLSVGPDGNCYIIDWSDTGECHEHNGVHRRSGRIFRISYGNSSPPQSFAKPWCADGDGPLQQLWARYRRDQVNKQELYQLLDDSDEHMRVWAVRLLTDLWPLDHVTGPHSGAKYPCDANDVQRLVRTALIDPSGLVRRQLASTLQRMPLEDRSALAIALISRNVDAADLDMNLLVWFGISPIGEVDAAKLVAIAAASRWPHLTGSIARFIASRSKNSDVALNQLVEAAIAMDSDRKAAVLNGLSEGFQGWRKASKPKAWGKFTESFGGSTNHDALVRQLNVLFGDGLALDEIRKIVLDGKVPNRDRQLALQTLIDAKPSDLRQICESLMDTRVVNSTAAKGLALFDDPAIARLLVQKYKRFQPDDRPGIVELLSSRASFAEAMLDEIAKGKSPLTRDDIKATHARQIRGFGVELLNEKLAIVWGSLNQTSSDKAAQIETWKTKLEAPGALEQADLKRGRGLFDKTCSQCHKLFGAGKQIGPELTGAQRSSLDYLLGNIIDPSAVVGREFRMTTILTDDGRAVSGLITSRDGQRIVIQTATDQVTVATENIDAIKDSTVSAMPEGLLQNMSEVDVRALIGYLMSPVQIEP